MVHVEKSRTKSNDVEPCRVMSSHVDNFCPRAETRETSCSQLAFRSAEVAWP